jgi:recombination protein RecR
MSEFPSPIERLVEQLVRLPGIGRRSAQRLAFFLARSPAEDLARLAASISSLPDELRPCATCGNLSGEETCAICRDPRRERSVLCVVEQPENVAAIERTGAYRGLYHVLGGAISPLRSIGPESLRISALAERLEAGSFSEVILATNPTVEGEATALYIARQIGPGGISVTRPATGLPVGGELDYIDRSTLARAFEGRRRLGG